MVPAKAPCAHLPHQRVQTYMSKVLLVLVSPMLVDNPEFYLVVDQVPVPSQLKHTGEGAPLKDTRAYPLTEWGFVERYWGISTQLEDPGVGAGRELSEGYQGNTHQWKGTAEKGTICLDRSEERILSMTNTT